MTNNAMTNNTMSNNTMTNNTMSNNTMTNNTMSNGNSRDCGNSIVGDLRDESGDIISMVVDVLDAAVRKVDAVVTLPGSGSIIRLLLVEPGSGDVISHSVLVGVGRHLAQVIVPNRMGHRVSDGHGASNSNSTVSYSNHPMPNAKTTSNANSMPDADSMSNPNSSQELGSSRGSNHQGREGDNNLHVVRG